MDLLNRLIEEAIAEGIEKLEIYEERENSFELEAYQGEVEYATICRQDHIYIEGLWQGWRGTVYLEELSEDLIPEYINTIKETAAMNEEVFQERDYPNEDQKLDFCNEFELPVSGEKQAESVHEMEKMLLDAEAAIYQADHRITNTIGCTCGYTQKTITLKNHAGREKTDSYGYYSCYFGVMGEADGMVQIGHSSQIESKLSRMNLKQTAIEAVTGCISKLDAKSCVTGRYAVILENHVAAQLLMAFLPGFYGSNLAKNLSFLNGKQGTKIAASCVTLQEEPMHSNGVIHRRFDDEGTETSQKALIRQGIFTSILHSRRSAKECGQKPSGNGFKRSYKDNTAIGVTNLCLEPGDSTMEELLRCMQDGLLITECDVFAGANALNGDFSLISKGYRVIDGKPVHGVHQITIAGNFLDMLLEIEKIGSDTRLIGDQEGCCIAPSLLVKGLMVSGNRTSEKNYR